MGIVVENRNVMSANIRLSQLNAALISVLIILVRVLAKTINSV